VEACLSCDVVSGRVATPGGVIFEDEVWRLTHQVSPAQLAGFLILQPFRHVEHVGELSSEESAALGPLLSQASHALMRVLAPEKVYVISFGSIVRHVHFWLVPLSGNLPADLKGPALLAELSSGRWACSEAEAADVAARVRVEMAKSPYFRS
jgi:diadenosine tetraphosphate (Ap4A) HIT family hydrolase